ncbi:MAG: hypothetical protein AB9861_18730 [Methanosarcina sp.]
MATRILQGELIKGNPGQVGESIKAQVIRLKEIPCKYAEGKIS